ncbi:MAG: 3'-5' exonuclease, partial [Hyphomicrobiaceae bacterium]
IGEEIEQIQRKGHRLNEIAILVRASFQMRAFEDRFITLGLPYRVIGGPRFYERQEVKDATAYFELVVNPANDLKFERVVNVPKRGLGDSALAQIHGHARARDLDLMQAARELIETDELKPRPRRSLADFVANLDRWRQMVPQMPHTELAELILDESGYTAMWQQDKSPQAHSRLENLKELVRFMGEFETLAGFLEHVSLVMDTETADDGDRVSLMTLHGAKGLEFETVFLPGWEEGLFPHQRAMDESGEAGLEEERRLAYVGITRARRRALVSFAQNRRVHALWQSQIPSRFVDELPEAHVAVSEGRGAGGAGHAVHGGASAMAGRYGLSRFDEPAAGFKSTYATPGWQRAKSQWASENDGRAKWKGKPNPTPQRMRTIEGELVAKSSGVASAFKRGDRVFHDKFGYGEVREVEGNKLTVDFEKAGEKRVIDSYLTAA